MKSHFSHGQFYNEYTFTAWIFGHWLSIEFHWDYCQWEQFDQHWKWIARPYQIDPNPKQPYQSKSSQIGLDDIPF